MKKLLTLFAAVSTLCVPTFSLAQTDELVSAPVEVDHLFSQSPDDHVLGPIDADVTIIAYASVTCPHCSAWFKDEWPAFKDEQIDTGKAKFILREFPTPPANLAYTGFMLANCAPDDERLDHIIHQMQIQDEIFDAVKAGNGKEAYDALAKRAGLEDEVAINTCFANKTHLEKIHNAAKRGQAAGMTGVPAFFVNGVKVNGEATSDKLADSIAQAKVALSDVTREK